MFHHNSNTALVVDVKSKQHVYQLLIELKEFVLGNLNKSFFRGGDFRYQGTLCVHDVVDLRN